LARVVERRADRRGRAVLTGRRSPVLPRARHPCAARRGRSSGRYCRPARRPRRLGIAVRSTPRTPRPSDRRSRRL